MPDTNDPNHGKDQADVQALSPLDKAYIDQQIKNFIERYDESQTKGKKLRNSWRHASPITKGSFIMTGGIAVATIAYAFVAWGQLCAMKRIAADNSLQTQQMIDVANQMKLAGWRFSGASIGTNNAVWGAVGKLNLQAERTLTQATATKKLAQTSNDALEAVQRAFIFPSPIITPILDSDGKISDGIRVQMTWNNNGTTPTRKMFVHYSYLPMKELPNNFPFPDLGDLRPIPTYLGPKGVFYSSSQTLSVNQLNEISEGSNGYYIWGWAKYRDVFAGTKDHITKYCYRIIVEKKIDPTKQSAIFTYQAQNCERNNCYDDECKSQ